MYGGMTDLKPGKMIGDEHLGEILKWGSAVASRQCKVPVTATQAGEFGGRTGGVSPCALW
jgi:hypothetical protein